MQLPKPPKLYRQNVDLREPDPLMSGPLGLLPKLEDLPEDWEIFLLHLVYKLTGLQASLPRIWDQEVGAHERLIAVSDHKLMECSHDPRQSYICDVMPASTAGEFHKWLMSQVFVRRSTGFYGEPVIQTFSAEDNSLVRRRTHIMTLTTLKGTLYVAEPLKFPVWFGRHATEADVFTRAKLVLEDPAAIVRATEEDIELMRKDPELQARVDAAMGQKVKWVRPQDLEGRQT